MKIEVFDFEGCPHSLGARTLVDRIAQRMLKNPSVSHIRVETDEAAQELKFLGSPTIRINGEDLERRTADSFFLGCRIYPDPSGLPPEWMIEAGILRALRPKHILFLCVANSARSQMAEGIARSLAPREVRISSAGSVPTQVRPEAIAVLKEIGIDATSQFSKGLDLIDSDSVEAVITLCAEEVCPIFPHPVMKLHWGLPDPASVIASEGERLQAFRDVRDELLDRLKYIF